MIDLISCHDAFDNAKLVRFDYETNLVFVWKGSMRIRVYDFGLHEVDTFSSDDWHDSYAEDDVNKSINRYINYLIEQRD